MYSVVTRVSILIHMMMIIASEKESYKISDFPLPLLFFATSKVQLFLPQTPLKNQIV
jgi:hypothetical protein